jgi:hypothetical protein
VTPKFAQGIDVGAIKKCNSTPLETGDGFRLQFEDIDSENAEAIINQDKPWPIKLVGRVKEDAALTG